MDVLNKGIRQKLQSMKGYIEPLGFSSLPTLFIFKKYIPFEVNQITIRFGSYTHTACRTLRLII